MFISSSWLSKVLSSNHNDIFSSILLSLTAVDFWSIILVRAIKQLQSLRHRMALLSLRGQIDYKKRLGKIFWIRGYLFLNCPQSACLFIFRFILIFDLLIEFYVDLFGPPKLLMIVFFFLHSLDNRDTGTSKVGRPIFPRQTWVNERSNECSITNKTTLSFNVTFCVDHILRKSEQNTSFRRSGLRGNLHI